MSGSQPVGCVPARPKTGSSMRLPLHNSGDLNGNAFPISSSSSSSSASSCLGESSPESLRSLSSLNSPGRINSPLDYDMFEVTLLTTVIDDKAGDIVVTKWPPEEEEEESDKTDLVYVERVQTITDQSESNDNSVSVYLDANSSQCTPEIWNENITLALSTNSTTSEKSSDNISFKRSLTPDSTTEIPEDEDNDDEAMFLSIGSDMELQRTSLTAIVAARWASKEASNKDERDIEVLNVQNTMEAISHRERENQSSEDGATSNKDVGKQVTDDKIKMQTSPPICDSGEKPIEIPKNELQKAGKPRLNAIARPIAANQVKNQGKVDLKNVKSKVGSWATSSPTKTAVQNKSSPVHMRRPAATITPVSNAKLQRPPLSPMKVAILRPLKGKSRPGPNQNPNQNQRNRSTSVSSLGSEEAANVGASRKIQEKEITCESLESKHPTRSVTEETKGEDATTKEKKVSTKLGTTTTSTTASTRPQAKGTKLGVCQPPGQQGSSGPRQVQNDGSSLGQAGQNPSNVSSGSPTKQRPNLGIPKPRFSTDRSLATTSSFTSSRPSPVTAASKLPVKGLPTTLSSSSLGSNANENNGGKATGASESDERPNRSALPVGSQSTARPPGSSDLTKASPMRNRALSLQARPPNTGLKAPSASNSNSAKSLNPLGTRTPPSANQSPTKQASQHPLQRSGSARLSRINSTVDKNKREVQTRASNVSGDRAVTNQNQNQSNSEGVPDAVNTPSASRVPLVDTISSSSAQSPTLSKPKTSARSSPKTASRLQPSAPRTTPSSSLVEDVKQSKEQVERKSQTIVQLRSFLLQGNRRVEALALVIQHLFSEREDTLKQKKELTQELSTLRDELVSTSQCCDQLQREKEEVRLGLEAALGKLQQQHKEELEQLENRLRSFYQNEWDKAQQMYQEEADKYRALMEEQVEDLRSQQEAERKETEETHSQNMETLKQQYETTLELKTAQQTELENLEKTLKETEASLSEKVLELTAQKDALSEKLNAEEERRKRILNDKSLDSHTLYLEQELESLKVVLEIKNNQLHQKDKKLMDMDKLAESNIKLEECLKKVQQENEDYKARMDRHAALSKQLSSEQAILQQTLQKESKVNKRLSMENEELLWKLHNGDLLASPRRLSPTSPFGSPRNSAAFTTAAPLSPR
ncbi:LOW QUALITY PROTEIN: microtubule-associated tumor suppressor 1 homolog [Periophthalmus magnuspinnatus]|uniref:LOW QUALITY PROTEIN: microtubule-associated tumor suppressor 1 homolog n=1 Tax=Periophthalmus magnuspinnatus TaxID=409849 RepID=UPI0024371FBA|nr:LOW QUALITY PROTEIN: microtubule-associated tumor suppressor 1 homolog [Periophthalmus magnuspinnatus]